jgi:predicted  nucleic acid-binding Zn-ribbon protein
MNPDLEKLVRLHHADAELRRLEGELGQVPRAREELDARVTGERSRLDAARSALEAATKARKAHEASVQDLEARRSKYKGQLMDVKTNKEYTAMLHEIEGVERDIRSREDQILEEMERMEGLAQDVKREEAEFKLVEAEAKRERAEIDAREAKLRAEAARAGAEREAALASVPETTRARYERIAKLRGTGVAEAKDGRCETCHVKLRVQVWVEVRKNESVIECDSCSRILYYEPPPPVVDVMP